MQDVGRQAGLVKQPDRLGRDQRRLLRRLGDHGVAGRQRRGDLAGEDGEGEIPWADAGEDAPPMQLQRIGLAGGPFQGFACAKCRSARSA